MNERLEQIRQLLSELEDEIGTGTASTGDRDFSALELPLIIQEIVDDLQPFCRRTKRRSTGMRSAIRYPRTAILMCGSVVRRCAVDA